MQFGNTRLTRTFLFFLLLIHSREFEEDSMQAKMASLFKRAIIFGACHGLISFKLAQSVFKTFSSLKGA
jgi:hypothetical protein